MSLTFTEQFLVVILSAFLALFLLLGIIVLAEIIQVMNHIKRITEKAEAIADRAEHISEFFQKGAGTASVLKVVSNIMSSIKEHKRKGD